jgi:hypothetical protein
MKITQSNIQDVFKSKLVSVETMELKGYELIEKFFVDSSGLGSPDEPALLAGSFLKELEKLVKTYGMVYTNIIDAGQFQVYVGVFLKSGKSQVKRLATNVTERKDGNKTIVRLYDTDIVTIEPNKTTLDSGGFQTSTTKKWINKFILSPFYVYQKDFDWFVGSLNDNKVKIPFYDGVVLEGNN